MITEVDENTSAASSAIMRVSLTRIGHNAIDGWVNAVCIMRTFAYACWLLRDFCGQGEDIAPYFFHNPYYYYYYYYYFL
jgi:hypothetical protein